MHSLEYQKPVVIDDEMLLHDEMETHQNQDDDEPTMDEITDEMEIDLQTKT